MTRHIVIEVTSHERKATRRLEVSVADLRRRLGERQTVDIDVLIGAQEVVASRTTDEPVIGQVVIESIERGVTVSGEITFGWTGDCRRCLEPVSGEITADIFEIYQVDAPEDSDDILELVGDSIDLVPLVRDTVLVSLPLAPLCSTDCPGPDPERYPAKTVEQLEAEAAEAGPQPDPRWAALDGIDFSSD